MSLGVIGSLKASSRKSCLKQTNKQTSDLKYKRVYIIGGEILSISTKHAWHLRGFNSLSHAGIRGHHILLGMSIIPPDANFLTVLVRYNLYTLKSTCLKCTI